MSGSASVPKPPDENRGPAVLAIQWIFCGLALVLVLTRTYIRAIIRKNLGWDDFTIWIATGLALFASILECLNVQNGLGRHLIYVKATAKNVEKYSLILSLENGMATTFVKLSACFFILRMIGVTQRPVRWMIYANLAILVPFTIAITVLQGVQCLPFDKLWEPQKHGRCLNSNTVRDVAKAYSAIGVVTDFVTAAAPIGIVYNLEVSKTRKFLLIALLGLGFFTAGCSIAKTRWIVFRTQDFTWDYVQVTIWSSLEHQLGIVVATIPTIQPAYRYIGSKVSNFSSQFRSTQRKTEGSQPFSNGFRQSGYQRSRSEDAIGLNDLSIRKTTQITVDQNADAHANKHPAEGRSFV